MGKKKEGRGGTVRKEGREGKRRDGKEGGGAGMKEEGLGYFVI